MMYPKSELPQYLIVLLLLFNTTLYGQSPTQFSELKCIPQILDPLVRYYHNGDTIRTVAEWEKHRNWIKKQAQRWILGHLPPAPESIQVEIEKEVLKNGVLLREVVIRFDGKASIRAKLHIPQSDGPHPLFLTQWNHEGWAAIALRRGYATCVYAAADALDDTQNYSEYYPDHDFGGLMGRTFGAMRVLDYLHTLPEEVDTTRIGITGHSRNGKQSLFVAAFDERVDAVIVSGGGVSPLRTHEYRYNPHDLHRTLADFPEWFSPNLPKFIGKPHLLPVDFNTIFALVAPRACLVSCGRYDLYSDSYGAEKSYNSVLSIYGLYGAADRAGIRQITARHTVTPRDVEEMLDFFDTQFGRKDFSAFQDQWHTFDFEDWKKKNAHLLPGLVESGRGFASLSRKGRLPLGKLTEAKALLLGEAPPKMERALPSQLPQKTKTDHIDLIIRGGMTVEGATRIDIRPYNTFGDYLMVTLFLPEGYEEKADGSLPSVLYLHDMSYSFGYAKKTYPGFSLSPMIESLVQSGFAVVTFDLPGFGSRHRELQNFYRRYPNWSLMGKMVTETQEVLSYMQQLAPLDPQNIHLLGNGLGATVATLSELQQFPLKHILLIDPYHQYYKAPSCFEGLSFLAQHHGLLPRIGLFERHEAALPFSFAEVLQGIRSPVTVGFSTASRHNDWEYLQALQQKTAAMENVQFKALEHDQGIRSSDFSWIIDQLQTEE